MRKLIYILPILIISCATVKEGIIEDTGLELLSEKKSGILKREYEAASFDFIYSKYKIETYKDIGDPGDTVHLEKVGTNKYKIR